MMSFIIFLKKFSFKLVTCFISNRFRLGLIHIIDVRKITKTFYFIFLRDSGDFIFADRSLDQYMESNDCSLDTC